MRILCVDLSPSWGGSLASLERLAGRLDRSVFEPELVLAACNPAAERFRALGLRVSTVPTFVADQAGSTALVSGLKRSTLGRRRHGLLARPWAAARWARDVLTRSLPLTLRLCACIRRRSPDLVHINDAVFVSRPVIAAAWLARVPAVCHVRSLGRLGRLDRFWGRTLAGFIFISRWVADDAAQQGLPAGKGRVIYDGLDPQPYGDLPARSRARATLGLPAGRPIVLALGRLVPWKGQDFFLAALRLVADAEPDVLGWIVGETETYSRDFGPRLHALAEELGLAGNVRFEGYTRRIAETLAAADLLAHTSVSPEPFGLVMLEAMAAGLPVVTPAEGGGIEIVVDRQTGLWYEPRNPAALARAILEIIRDPVRGAALGAAGRARVADFNLEQFVAGMSRFYLEQRRSAGERH